MRIHRLSRFLLLIIWVAGDFLPHPVVSAASRSALEEAHPGLQATGADITWNPATGVPDFITFPRKAPPDGAALSPAAVPSPVAVPSLTAAALNFFTAYAPAYQMVDPSNELVVERVTTDDMGYTHVRLAQRAGGLPVFGAVLLVHFAPNGAITAVNGRYSPGVPALGKPALDERAAFAAASDALRLNHPYVGESELLVFNPALVDTRYANQPHLAYRLRLIEEAGGAPWVAFVDAQNGRLLFSYQDRAAAKAIEVYQGRTYEDPKTRCYPTSSEPPDDCTLAFNHTSTVYDYYHDTFHRDSFDDAGATMIANIQGDQGTPAYWDGRGETTNFAPGMATLDIVAHEWTHAVIQYTAGLEYSGQSGALNESFADIFAVMVDRDDWVLGDDLGSGLRDLADPPRMSQPDRFSSYQVWGDVHENSGIPNKGAYLMAEGGAFNGYTITGIGRANTEQIDYRTLSQYLTPTSSFLDAYHATLLACADLFGAGSSTCASVQAALRAVEMDDPDAPIAPRNPAPMDGFKRVVPGTEYLMWHTQDPSDGATWYHDVTFGSDANNLELLCEKIQQQLCPMPAGLVAGSTYYWQVKFYNDTESELKTGKIWSFTVSDGSAITLPFSDNFSGGTLAAGWNLKTTGVGKVQFDSLGGVVLTRQPEDIASAVDLSLVINMSEVPAGAPLTLQLDWVGENFSAVEDPYGLVLSDGARESVVIPIQRSPSGMTRSVETVDLKQAAANAGLSTSGKLHIIFRILSIDNNPYTLSEDLLRLYRVTLSTGIAVSDFNCDTVTDVSKAECQALAAFYTGTNAEDGWRYRGSWLRNNNLCEWFGITCVSGHVTGLALPDNNLVGTTPVSLNALSFLETLNLRNNDLNVFPVLPNGITYLDLSNNHITGTIPDALLELQGLQYLYLNNNDLEGSIPPGLGQPLLISLNLSDNRLEGSIPAGLFTETIRFLQLGSNNLSGAIPAEVLNAHGLLVLYLEINRLTVDPANTAVLNRLNEVCKGWDRTQTVAPTDVTGLFIPGVMARVLFTPIPYQWFDGGYEAVCATSENGDYAPCGSIADKTQGALPLEGLPPGARYFVKVRSFTPANSSNKNDLWSDYSAPVLVTTLDSLPIETRESFEGPQLGKGWLRLITGRGRVRLSNELPYAGSNSLVLGCTTEFESALSAAVVTFDLDGVENAVLSFYWADFDPVDHPEDGVFISDDYGAHWTHILSLDSGTNDYRRAQIDLAAAAADHGLALNDHFQVKFQFYDQDMTCYLQQGALTGYSIDLLELSRYGWRNYLPAISK